MRARAFLLAGVAFTLALRPAAAYAQLATFVQGVRDLADAAGRAEPSRSNGIRTAADRIGKALIQWDRDVSALENRVAHEVRGAPDRRAYQLHVELGVAYRVRGRTADAVREFDAAAALQPSASDLQVLRAFTLEAIGRSKDAGQAFLTAWNLDAGNSVKAYYVTARAAGGNTADRDRARVALINAYTRRGRDAGRPAAAPFLTLDAIPDNLSRAPAIADDETADGFALLRAGKYSEAVRLLQQVGRGRRLNAKDSPLAHFERGRRAEAQNRVSDARREYQAALEGTLLGRSILLVGIARLAQVEGDLTAAIDAFRQAVQLNPNDSNIRRELASAYAADGRSDDAFCELMAALVIDPRDAQTHAAIGQVYLDTERYTEAVTAFNRALELAPDRYEIRYALATAHIRLGNTLEAEGQLQMFERARREALDRRRRDIANDVQREEALTTGGRDQGGGR